MLLVFGCAVALIALAGSYVYLREAFAGVESPIEITAREGSATREGVEVHL